jgi:hypothetical protein
LTLAGGQPHHHCHTNGKITEAWDSYDALGFMQQIGAVPLSPVTQAAG